MQVAVYGRKSEKEELEPGEREVSTVRQMADGRKFAELRGWTVRPEHEFQEDGVSAYNGKTRKEFERLLTAIERSEVEGVVF